AAELRRRASQAVQLLRERELHLGRVKTDGRVRGRRYRCERGAREHERAVEPQAGAAAAVFDLQRVEAQRAVSAATGADGDGGVGDGILGHEVLLDLADVDDVRNRDRPRGRIALHARLESIGEALDPDLVTAGDDVRERQVEVRGEGTFRSSGLEARLDGQA